MEVGGKAKVVVYGHVLVQHRALWQEPEAVPGGGVAGRQALLEQRDDAFLHGAKAGNKHYHRGLPGAVRSKQTYDRPRAHREANAHQRVHLASTGLKVVVDVFDAQSYPVGGLCRAGRPELATRRAPFLA